MIKEIDFAATDEFKAWWTKNGKKLCNYSIYSKAAVIWNASKSTTRVAPIENTNKETK